MYSLVNVVFVLLGVDKQRGECSDSFESLIESYF